MVSTKTSEHLNGVETAIGKARELLAKHGYPDTPRTVVLLGLISQLVEHHEAVLLLVRNGKVGSAFALQRSIFEGVYRGMWLNFCATELQVQGFEQRDILSLTTKDMARAIDTSYHADGFFCRTLRQSVERIM